MVEFSTKILFLQSYVSSAAAIILKIRGISPRQRIGHVRPILLARFDRRPLHLAVERAREIETDRRARYTGRCER